MQKQRIKSLCDNKMTFFSGTDTQTLNEEGEKQNHFVSLIVNNDGKYTAAITRKLNIERSIVDIYSYRSFGDEEEHGNNTAGQTLEVVEYSMLNINKTEVSNPYSGLEARINGILESKKRVPSLFSTPKYEEIRKEEPVYWSDNIRSKYSSVSVVTNEEIDDWFMQILTGSITTTRKSKINPVRWARTMSSAFEKRFNTMLDYENWVSTLIDFLIAEYPETAVIAAKLQDKFKKLPYNTYIETIIGVLELYNE